jgi:hypothetical protein
LQLVAAKSHALKLALVGAAPTCGPLDCHHRSYANFGREEVGDLSMLCRDCHTAITASVRARRNTVPGNALWAIGLTAALAAA